ncbi:sulfhydrogenase subunit beta (sulfur reductase) [Dysgonomonas sp. PH5-45]|uniref:4Fe-4S dicluster domain-containing protein n=1 Tax=unclassified Dysgonomonas TaxID=2630389 RepID=UPI0024762FEE|nr:MULTISPECIES: 4Fe-4S dicluster domain-containing protein [unclassified Dysgonomonas]MDH6354413.1 sulfhydrogenase subunit beta (sulfur reductase) [Dysgonomonas sp. PH5-45]MDH6387312.1 sulfhydrogenase subunit beta (sulfur reductase) [Dysgonomonas sp. PH5-37]
MERKYISDESLKTFINQLNDEGRHVYAPVAKGEKTEFERVKSFDKISLDHIQTTQSIKAVAFPRTEKLFSYTKNKGDVTLEDYNPDLIPEMVVFGLHPCDAAGFKPLSNIFNWGTPDVPFNERRRRTTLIAMSCTQSDEFCFCTSVNGGPGNTAGSDILLTPIKDKNGYLVEVVSEKGQELVSKYAGLFGEAPDVDKEAYLAKLSRKFSLDDLRGKISHMFESEVWKKQSERCLGCGACAFVCPTCACFDIQEDTKGSKGNRLRCWDSCGFSLFTFHTSGHNPREVQSQRWRQRLLHKFSYMPERLSVVGCTGCGRCSRACPVDMNISDHLAEIADLSVVTTEKEK